MKFLKFIGKLFISILFLIVIILANNPIIQEFINNLIIKILG